MLQKRARLFSRKESRVGVVMIMNSKTFWMFYHWLFFANMTFRLVNVSSVLSFDIAWSLNVSWINCSKYSFSSPGLYLKSNSYLSNLFEKKYSMLYISTYLSFFYSNTEVLNQLPYKYLGFRFCILYAIVLQYYYSAKEGQQCIV